MATARLIAFDTSAVPHRAAPPAARVRLRAPTFVGLHLPTVTHPRAAERQRAFAVLGTETAVAVDAGPPRITAHPSTPSGRITVASLLRPLA